MCLKWYFRNELTLELSHGHRQAFSPKYSWNSPTGHSNLEVFLSQIEYELFQIPDKCLPYSKPSKEEWQRIDLLLSKRLTNVHL